jgi:hypothetical protein
MAEQCPTCRTRFSVDNAEMAMIPSHCGELEQIIEVYAHICPECAQRIVYASISDDPEEGATRIYPPLREQLDFSEYVPPGLLRDFEEARKVLDISPKASAMLSRRCLQRLLREQVGLKAKNLDQEIESALLSNLLPSYLADDLDAVRIVGNFAAHPTKSEATGEIVDVEPGEAAWTIEVLEGLFDFCFVAPIKADRRRQDLNKKLTESGRQPMKLAPVIVIPQRNANA